jgi:hypothetical protein
MHVLVAMKKEGIRPADWLTDLEIALNHQFVGARNRATAGEAIRKEF